MAWTSSDRVEFTVGFAAEPAQRLINADIEPSDLVFIDADRPSNPIRLDAGPPLAHPGAVIVVDKLVREGAVIEPDIVDAWGHEVVVAIAASAPSGSRPPTQSSSQAGTD